MKNKNPFRLEEVRDTLAKELRYKELAQTYMDSNPEIEDNNTSELWNTLNLIKKPRIVKNPMEEERLKFVVSCIRNSKSDFFNIGFGTASLEKKYFEKNVKSAINWSGIDISDESVKYAKKKFPKCTFEIGDILELKKKSERFNYVIALEVLEHIRPSVIFKALDGIYTILKQGGYFIASVPLNEGLEEMIKNGDNPNAHVRIYTSDLIKAELKIAGFEIKKEKTLYAFHNLYKIKSFIARNFMNKNYLPNNIIIIAQKP